MRAAIAFVTSMAVARFLGPEGRGEVAYAVSAASLMSLISVAGIIPAVNREKQNTSADEMRRAVVHATCVRVAIVMAGGSVLAAIGVTGSVSPLVLVGAAILTPIVALQATLSGLASVKRADLAAGTVLLSSTALQAMTVGLLVVAGFLSPLTTIAAWVAPGALSVLALNRLFLRRPPAIGGRKLLRSSAAGGAGEVGLGMAWRVDNILIAPLLGLGDLGRYAVATSIAEVSLALTNGVRLAFLQQRSAEQGRSILSVSGGLLAAGVPLGGLAYVIAPTVVPAVVGPEFAGLEGIIAVLVPSAVALGMSYLLIDHAVAVGAGRMAGVAGISAILSNVALNLLLIPAVGVLGAALATAMSYGLCVAILLFAVRSISGEAS